MLDDDIYEAILKDIKMPEFYSDIAAMTGVTFYHGSHFVDRPHYEKDE